ncbi:MAG: hypothetical protein L6R41_001881 [Letrouitia leprolyta]|nr:MAG: hypothetical protein L6R41_001881 [Letrouitia leprolyta]
MERFLQTVASLEQEEVKDFQDPSSSPKRPGISNIWINQFPSICHGSASLPLLASTNEIWSDLDNNVPQHGFSSTTINPTITSQSSFFPLSPSTHQTQSQQPSPRQAASDSRHYNHCDYTSATSVCGDPSTWLAPFLPGRNVDHSTSYGDSNPHKLKQTRPAAEVSKPFKYGSDPQFAKNRFIAPTNQRTEESITIEVLRQFQCLDPQGSVITTRTSSPFVEGQKGLDLRSTDPMDTATRVHGSENILEVLPKRQRPSTTQEKDYILLDESPLSPQKSPNALPVKKRGRPKAQKSDDQIATQGQHPKKKRARKKLSDEEKRSNHVNSEQKRRDEQNRQWNDLLTFVPGIREGYRSKCDKIVYANRWLHQLLNANERMESYLLTLDSNSSSSGPD